MKKVLNNKKGFTLIELLAVIVILAILVMAAIPAVTRYLTDARKGTFADNARTAISAVRNDVIMNGGQATVTYTLDGADSTKKINDLLEKQLTTSPFGAAYSEGKIIATLGTDGGYTFQMCLYDAKGNGFQLESEDDIKKENVKTSGVTSCGTGS